jgi:hypothetical protein
MGAYRTAGATTLEFLGLLLMLLGSVMGGIEGHRRFGVVGAILGIPAGVLVGLAGWVGYIVISRGFTACMGALSPRAGGAKRVPPRKADGS